MKSKIVSFDNYSKEADILLDFNEFSILIYCPMLSNKKISNNIILESLLTKNIEKVQQKECAVKTDDGYYSYKIIAKVTNIFVNRIEVTLYDIKIIIMSSVNDIQIGDFISFCTSRLDYIY